MPKQNEVEIKLRLDPEKIRNFANSEGLAGVQPLKNTTAQPILTTINIICSKADLNCVFVTTAATRSKP